MNLYPPSLAKRGWGRFYKHYFKIPLYPPEAVKKFRRKGD